MQNPLLPPRPPREISATGKEKRSQCSALTTRDSRPWKTDSSSGIIWLNRPHQAGESASKMEQLQELWLGKPRDPRRAEGLVKPKAQDQSALNQSFISFLQTLWLPRAVNDAVLESLSACFHHFFKASKFQQFGRFYNQALNQSSFLAFPFISCCCDGSQYHICVLRCCFEASGPDSLSPRPWLTAKGQEGASLLSGHLLETGTSTCSYTIMAPSVPPQGLDLRASRL